MYANVLCGPRKGVAEILLIPAWDHQGAHILILDFVAFSFCVCFAENFSYYID